MPLSPIESITYANQSMTVASTKQTDHQNRIEKQAYAAVEALAKKETTVTEVNELTEDKAIDPEKEHNREQAEKEGKEKELDKKENLSTNSKVETKDDFESPLHILDIKA